MLNDKLKWGYNSFHTRTLTCVCQLFYPGLNVCSEGMFYFWFYRTHEGSNVSFIWFSALFANENWYIHTDSLFAWNEETLETRIFILHRKRQTPDQLNDMESSASLVFVRGIHRIPVNSPHRGPVTRKMFLFEDVIMLWWVLTMGSSCIALCFITGKKSRQIWNKDSTTTPMAKMNLIN